MKAKLVETDGHSGVEINFVTDLGDPRTVLLQYATNEHGMHVFEMNNETLTDLVQLINE
jgi:hypothetical protein